MINTPGESIVFTATEQGRLTLLENRLEAIRKDITKEKENLSITKDEGTNLLKEKLYTQELLSDLQVKLAEAQKEYDVLNNHIVRIRLEADTHAAHVLEVDALQDKRQKELDKKESDLEELQKSFSKKETAFVRMQDSVAADKESVKSAKKSLLDAIGKIEL